MTRMHMTTAEYSDFWLDEMADQMQQYHEAEKQRNQILTADMTPDQEWKCNA